MRTLLIFTTTIIVLYLTVPAQAGPLQAFGSAPAIPSSPAEAGPGLLRAGPSTSGATLNRPPASYRPYSGPADPPADENEFPRYPYPPFPNPYFEGASNRNVLSEGIDWIWGASTSVAGRVSNFVDARLFPAKPATQGAGVSQDPASAAVPAPGDTTVSVGPVPGQGTVLDPRVPHAAPNVGPGLQ
jgi:hypothetical protein